MQPVSVAQVTVGGICPINLIVRSYQGENVRSRPISETKHLWANSVLTWGTSWESLVLNVFSPHGVREPGSGNGAAAGSSPAGGRLLGNLGTRSSPKRLTKTVTRSTPGRLCSQDRAPSQGAEPTQRQKCTLQGQQEL